MRNNLHELGVDVESWERPLGVARSRMGYQWRPDERGWPPLNPTWLELRQVYRSAPRGSIKHTVFAAKLGLRSVVLRGLFFRGRLPGAVQHTTNIILVPKGLLLVAQMWGLARLRDWAADRHYRSAFE